MIDLAFVLHSAGTVHAERWRYMTQFVINVIKRLDVGPNRTRVAVITWSDTAYVEFTLDWFTSRQDVTQVRPTLLFCTVGLQSILLLLGLTSASRQSSHLFFFFSTTIPLNDWIVQCFTSPPTQYRLYGRRFLQVKRPNQQYQSTE